MDTHEMSAMSMRRMADSPQTVTMTPTDLQDRCLGEVYAYAYRRVGNREDAEDITAEVYAAALESLGRGDIRVPRAWLLGIARRKLADLLRRKGKRHENLLSDAMSIPSKDGNPDSFVQNDEATRTIRDIVDDLPEKQREALLLQYLEDLSIVEISQVMGKSPAAVNSLLQRARVTVFNQGKAYFLDTLEVTR